MRSSTPTGSIRRRISGLSAQRGALKALSSEELDGGFLLRRAGSAGSARRSGRCASAASCSRRRSRRRGSSRATTGRAGGRRPPRDPRTARRCASSSPARASPATRSRFFMPSVVDATASSSPTASVSSPGSDAGGAFGREAQPRRRVLLPRPLVERLLLGFRRRSRRESACSPTSSPTCRRDRSSGSRSSTAMLVFRLRDVVEARVVHQRRRVAVLLHPLRVAHPRRRDTSSWPSCCAGSRACGRLRGRRRIRPACPSGRRAAAASSRADRARRPGRSTSCARGS